MMTRSMGWRSFASAAAVLTVSTGAALADPTAADILSTFNLVTTGNVSTGSDIVGNAVIGGNVTASTFFGGGNNVPASPELSVYGTVSSSFNFAKAGTLFYSGTVNQGGFPTVNFNGGSQVTTLPHPLSYYTAPLVALSTQLSGMSGTAGATFSNGVFNAGGATGIVLFDLTATDLEAGLVNHDISFSGPAGVTYIVNVSGDFSMPNSSHLNTLYSHALFNFYDALTVNLGSFSAPRYSRPTLRFRSLAAATFRGRCSRSRTLAEASFTTTICSAATCRR